MTKSELNEQLESWDSLKNKMELLTHLQNRRRYAYDTMISFREARRGTDPKAPFSKIWKKSEQNYKRIYWETCERLRHVMLGE